MQRLSIYADDVALFVRPLPKDLNFSGMCYKLSMKHQGYVLTTENPPRFSSEGMQRISSGWPPCCITGLGNSLANI